jgi:hypothetical protein
MTRFKELRRVERAIEHRDATELKWAQAYCEHRIGSTTLKRGQDKWRRLLRRVVIAHPNE